MVQWLGLHPFTAEGPGPEFDPYWGNNIPQAMWHGEKLINRNKDAVTLSPQMVTVTWLLL